jgi:hypothetical protein
MQTYPTQGFGCALSQCGSGSGFFKLQIRFRIQFQIQDFDDQKLKKYTASFFSFENCNFSISRPS